MSAIFGIAPLVKTLGSIMGRRQKHLFDKSVGLARSFPREHWFLELVSLDGTASRRAALAFYD